MFDALFVTVPAGSFKPLCSLPRLALLACLALSMTLAACSAVVRAGYLELLPLRGFEVHAKDAGIHFEPGARAAADNLSAHYEQAVAQVEASLGGAIEKKPLVYLCASDVCFNKYAFNRSGRAEARGRGDLILLKAKLLQGEGRLLAVFTHELVHAFWSQRGVHCTPRWWTEGLAVESSGGGGAEEVTVAAAIDALRDGQVFSASSENSCLSRMPPEMNGMAWPLFYRQSGMFVAWLRVSNAAAFSGLLKKLLAGENLSPAMETSYGKSMVSLHKKWQSSTVVELLTQCEAQEAQKKLEDTKDRRRLRPPDPQLCAGQQPNQAFAHQLRNVDDAEGPGWRSGAVYRGESEAGGLTRLKSCCDVAR